MINAHRTSRICKTKFNNCNHIHDIETNDIVKLLTDRTHKNSLQKIEELFITNVQTKIQTQCHNIFVIETNDLNYNIAYLLQGYYSNVNTVARDSTV